MGLKPVNVSSSFSLASVNSLKCCTEREREMASIAATTTEVFLPQQHSLRSTPRQPSLCVFSPKTLLGGGGGSFSHSISIQASPKSNINTVVVSEKKNRSSFAKTSAVRHLVGSLTKSEGHRFAVVVARFNEVVTRLLLDGALETFKRYSVKEEDVDVVWVPGSFEIPLVAERLGKLGNYQAIICIGAVVRGDTTHYDAVANSAASGVLSAGLSSGVPCIFGVLTCDSMDQALNRAGGKVGNKGSEAALTAIEMASLFEHHLKK